MTVRRTRSPRPLFIALAELNVPEELKGPARNFLNTDFSQLRNQADFDRSFNGLMYCQQLLGPLHIRHFQTLEAMGKCLRFQHKAWQAQQREWFTDQIQSAFEKTSAILEENQGLLIREVWPQVKAILEPIVTGKKK